MDARCLLCDDPLGVRAIGAVIVVGNVAEPDAGVLCRRCAALPDHERKRRRDVAMARLLRSAIATERDPLSLPK